MLSIGQITLGQFVAAEVIVGTLLLNVDTVTRRIYAMTYILTSLLDELDRVLALPKHDAVGAGTTTQLPDPALYGVHLTCKDVAFAYPHSPPLFEHVNLEVAPGKNSQDWFDPASRNRRWRWCSPVSTGRRPASSGTTMSTFAT